MRKLAVITIVLAALLPAGAQGALGANGRRIELMPLPAKVLWGRSVELKGRISSHRAGQVITVLARIYGSSAPAKATVVLTRSGGYWNTSDYPSIRTTYVADWGGTTSARFVVGVQPAAALTQLVSGQVIAHIDGPPSLIGRTVELQRSDGSRWTTIARSKLGTRLNATFAKPVTSGSAMLRAAMSVNTAGVGLLGTTSHPLDYHTAFISISAPQTKVLYGKSLQISGRTSIETPGRAVTILAWAYGDSSPAKIGTVMTGPGGRWSVFVKPTIQTSYLARWGSADSSKLVVGVRPLASLKVLSSGRVAAHVSAGMSLFGRKVELQRLQVNGGAWTTLAQMPLDKHSNAVFPALSAASGSTLRIAMSVNEAGAGLLGTTSHPFTDPGV